VLIKTTGKGHFQHTFYSKGLKNFLKFSI
jgi:hypothetical protein